MLYCKGADSALLPLLAPGHDGATLAAAEATLGEWAQLALRTLVFTSGNCLSLRSGTAGTARRWSRRRSARSTARAARRDHHTPIRARGSSPSRAPPRSRTSSRTACPRCSPTSGAGIKVWMLTGDKVGTAKNIATACNILPPDARVTELTDEVYPQLKKIKQQDLIQAHPHPPAPQRPPHPPHLPAPPRAPLLTASGRSSAGVLPRGPVAGGSTNAEARVTHARSHRRAMARQMRRGGSARAHTRTPTRVSPTACTRPPTLTSPSHRSLPLLVPGARALRRRLRGRLLRPERAPPDRHRAPRCARGAAVVVRRRDRRRARDGGRGWRLPRLGREGDRGVRADDAVAPRARRQRLPLGRRVPRAQGPKRSCSPSFARTFRAR